MKNLFRILGITAIGLFRVPSVEAASMPGFDEQGYIREWLRLAPIALPEERTAADLSLREQVKDEAALRPREGDRLELAGGERTWTRVTAPTNYFDFNALLGSQNDHA